MTLKWPGLGVESQRDQGVGLEISHVFCDVINEATQGNSVDHEY